MTHAMRRYAAGGVTVLIAPPLLSAGLFSASVFAPPLGALAVAPLYYAFAAQGAAAGGFALLAGAVLAGAVNGAGPALFYAAFCGSMAWSMAWLHSRGASLTATLAVGTAVPYALSALLFSILLGGGEGSFSGWVAALVGVALESYRAAAVEPEVTGWIDGNRGLIIALFTRIFFSLSLLSVLLAAVMNYLVIRVFSERLAWGVHSPDHSLTRWKAPEAMVWVLIVSGFGFFILSGAASAVALNVLLLSGAVYLFQGVAVIHHFLQKARIPAVLMAAGYFLLFSQPPLLVAASALGLAEVWAGFRKLEGGREDEHN